MPAFGGNGFSATRSQTQAYRQATTAPAAAQPLSMPAYAQASGAGAAQPVAPSAQPAANQTPMTLSQSRVWSQDRAAERKKSWDASSAFRGHENLTPEQYAANEAQNKRQQAERERERLATLDANRQKSGLSQSTFDYLRNRKQSDAPTYEQWQEIANNSAGILDPSRAAYDARVAEQQGMQGYLNRSADPAYRNDNFRTTPATAGFDFGAGFNTDRAIEGYYNADAYRATQQSNAESLARWNAAREAATASGVDYATGRPLAELQVKGNSGEYTVGSDGKPVKIADLRAKARSEGWDYDTGRPLTAEGVQQYEKQRLDSIITRLGR